jgi:glycosyltransferase involved in cell wall biosynthesis
LIDVYSIVSKLNKPYYITIHDYFYICPQITLIKKSGQSYCGEPGVEECNNCVSENNQFNTESISHWRSNYANLIGKADIVICPSIDVSNRIKKYFNNNNYITAYHEPNNNSFQINKIILNKDEPLKIAVLGAIAPHKGSDLLFNLINLIKSSKSQFHIRLIGYIQGDQNLELVKNNEFFSMTGEYDDEALEYEIEKYSPHLILFTSRCPETYSYTLSAALQSKRPILAPNIGAFPERLNYREWSWQYEMNESKESILSKLISIRKSIENNLPPPINSNLKPPIFIEENFYEDKYLKFYKINSTTDLL